jgi:hypothetical protein
VSPQHGDRKIILIIINSPDASMVEPSSFISSRNGFAMTFRDFISHLMDVLDQLGMSMHARTAFIKLWLFLFQLDIF